MEIYYFHLRDGTDSLLDPEGRALPDLAAVATQALREARALVGADALLGKIDMDQRIVVHDAQDKIIHTLRFDEAVEITHSATSHEKRDPE